jgi:hypothetical protein
MDNAFLRYDKRRRTTSLRCPRCGWKFRCPTNQSTRVLCRACEGEVIKNPRKRDEAYLARVRQMPCCICQEDTTVEAHHPRIGSIGMGRKNDDDKAVPLCGRHHRELHTMSEREFWARHGVDPFAYRMPE